MRHTQIFAYSVEWSTTLKDVEKNFKEAWLTASHICDQDYML